MKSKIYLLIGTLLIVCVVCIYSIILLQRTDEPIEDAVKYDIITASGECWVVDRSSDGLVKDSLFHSDNLDECYNFIKEKRYD